ncbi:MAG: HEAT repeat domain-containing protein, partial [Candidatus Electrothrix sp. AR4]|nr:HEAT repeat domain-containing protein [Candidatus Electrothrix sp. AR4]
RFNVAKTLDIEGLIALFDKHCRDDDWREVLRLICGQIDEKFVGRIVEHLATRTDLEKWDGETPLPELPLAIGCLSEARSKGVLEPVGITLLDLATQIYRCGGSNIICPVLYAAKELGNQWPGGIRLRGLTESMISSLSFAGQLYWPQFVGAICRDRNLIQSFFDHDLSNIRWDAIIALAEHWPDESTRQLLTERAVQDKHEDPRRAALRVLAEKWPDKTTRRLLEQRAVRDEHEDPRSSALEALADKWPDETTRELLTDRTVQDEHKDPRSTALRTLAEKWPDETTRKLLTERAVQDKNGSPRSTALRTLAEKWPDETTRRLLTERAVQDDHKYPRSTALEALAEHWPDETTRQLLTDRAVQDEDG